MTARIVVGRTLPGPAFALLRDAGDVWVPAEDRPLTPEELANVSVRADAIVALLHDRIDVRLLDAAGSQLRIVANVAVGYDNIDVRACDARGVLVTNTPGVLVDATADLTLALLLGITRRVAEGDRLLRAGERWSWSLDFMLGSGLHGKQLGIIGFGQIGQAVARRAAAFGMTIAYAGRHEVAAGEWTGVAALMSLNDLLSTSDVVSVHCPLSAETTHLIDRAALRRMRPTAYLINTARGPIVDEAALADALKDGMIAGAALDVFEAEPAVHPGLLDSDRTLLTPHLGSATLETREAMAVLAARNVVEVLAGRPALTPVTPPR